jgi:hypothetical protein
MTPPTTSRPRAGAVAFACVGLALAVLLLAPERGLGQDLHGQLSQKRSQLQAERSKEARLSATLENYSARISQLSSQVAALRDREARVQQELAVKQAELRRAKANLVRLRKRLQASMKVLRERLVATYESAPPDTLNLILSAHGFNQLSARYEYLSAIENQDASIVATVRRLRNEARDTVDRIQAARDQLAAQRAFAGEVEQRKSPKRHQRPSRSNSRSGSTGAIRRVRPGGNSLGTARLIAWTGPGRPSDLPVPGLLASDLGPDGPGGGRHHDAGLAPAGDGIGHGDDRPRSRRVRDVLSDHPYLVRRLLLRPLRAHRCGWNQRLDWSADRHRPHGDVGKLDHPWRI